MDVKNEANHQNQERTNLEQEIAELQRLENLSNHPKVKELLSNRWHTLEADLIILEDDLLIAANTECILHKETKSPAPQSVNNEDGDNIASPVCESSEASRDVYLSSYAWDQSDSHAILYVSEDLASVELLDPQFITTSFTSTSVRLEVHQFRGKNFHFIVDNLWGKIVPHESQLKIKKDHLILMLKKFDDEKHWPSITAVEINKDDLIKNNRDIDKDTKQAIIAAAENDSDLKMGCSVDNHDRDAHLKSL